MREIVRSPSLLSLQPYLERQQQVCHCVCSMIVLTILSHHVELLTVLWHSSVDDQQHDYSPVHFPVVAHWNATYGIQR